MYMPGARATMRRLGLQGLGGDPCNPEPISCIRAPCPQPEKPTWCALADVVSGDVVSGDDTGPCTTLDGRPGRGSFASRTCVPLGDSQAFPICPFCVTAPGSVTPTNPCGVCTGNTSVQTRCGSLMPGAAMKCMTQPAGADVAFSLQPQRETGLQYLVRKYPERFALGALAAGLGIYYVTRGR